MTYEQGASESALEQDLKDQLLNKLSNYLDKIIEQSGILLREASEILRQLIPNATPYPNLRQILPHLQQIFNYRQDPKQLTPNPHIPNLFPYLHKGKVRTRLLPNHLRLTLRPTT